MERQNMIELYEKELEKKQVENDLLNSQILKFQDGNDIHEIKSSCKKKFNEILTNFDQVTKVANLNEPLVPFDFQDKYSGNSSSRY